MSRARAPAPAPGKACRFALLLAAIALPLLSCHEPGTPAATGRRAGDEIVVCGQFFHTGAPVVLWTDPGGYNAYLNQPRFVATDPTPWSLDPVPDRPASAHYGLRNSNLPPHESRRAEAEAPPADAGLRQLQRVVDQFVIHYDGSGVSRECFRTLHDRRGLSVHFMLDIDGTIYQTLDLQERAWHATIANSRSIGIEIANPGAYPLNDSARLDEWYRRDASGGTFLAIPARLGDGGVRTRGFVGRPVRRQPVVGVIQGRELQQYDLTVQQYESLIRLTAALCRIFPEIRCDYPHDAHGDVIPRKLDDVTLAGYRGLLGHYHVQTNKEDPGPAFQWDLVVHGRERS